MSKKYTAVLEKMFLEQKNEAKEMQPELDGLLEKLISVEKGIEIVQMYPELATKEISGKFPTSDLLYLSLIEELPKKTSPTDEFNLRHNGLVFKLSEKNHKRAEFVPALRNYINIEKMLKYRSFNDVSEEGSLIARHLKNTAIGARNWGLKYSTIKIIDALIGEVNYPSKFLSIYFDDTAPIEKHNGEIMFTRAGAMLIDLAAKSPKYLKYSNGGQVKINKMFEDAKSYTKKTPTIKESLIEKAREEGFVRQVYNKVQEKLLKLPESMLSEVEQQTLKLAKKHNIRIPHKGCNFERMRFGPPITLDDLNVIDKLLEVVKPYNGYFVEVQKEYALPNYSKFGLDAPKAMSRRRAYTLSSEFGEDTRDLAFAEALERYFAKGISQRGVLKIDNIELEAMRQDFKRFCPMVIELNVNRQIFYELPKTERERYAYIARDRIDEQTKMLQRFEYSPGQNQTILAKLDFVSSLSKYLIANSADNAGAAGKNSGLSEGRYSFFEKIFKKSDKKKPDYLLDV